MYSYMVDDICGGLNSEQMSSNNNQKNNNEREREKRTKSKIRLL